MATYEIRYETTMFYIVEIEADSFDDALAAVVSKIGDHESVDLDTQITSIVKVGD
jgi:hypothetical protein